LLVFDNATDPAGLRGWLPPGAGHVIVTSRRGGFDQLAVSVAVDVFTRVESTTMLRNRLPALTDQDADRLAVAVGDLPLALAQATGLLATTGMPVVGYLGRYRRPGDRRRGGGHLALPLTPVQRQAYC
jgi:hypothetical protein